MQFDYGDKATSITALGAIIRQAILENKKINEMAIEDTAQEPLIFRDIDEHYSNRHKRCIETKRSIKIATRLLTLEPTQALY